MDAELLRLATTIASQSATLANQLTVFQWVGGIVAALVAASIVGTGLYLRKRVEGFGERLGQIEAETKQIETIKANLAATTKVAESIKSEIAYRDWQTRERAVVLRGALERAATAAFEVISMSEAFSRAAASEEMPNDATAPGRQLESLTKLYFPTLQIAANEIRMASLTYCKDAVELHTAWKKYAITAASRDARAAQYEAEFDAINARLQPVIAQKHMTLLSLVSKFAEAASAEMQTLIPSKADERAKPEGAK